MPKKVWLINRFEGGLNKVANDKDIQENELAEIELLSPFAFGKIRFPGRFEEDYFHTTDANAGAQ